MQQCKEKPGSWVTAQQCLVKVPPPKYSILMGNTELTSTWKRPKTGLSALPVVFHITLLVFTLDANSLLKWSKHLSLPFFPMDGRVLCLNPYTMFNVPQESPLILIIFMDNYVNPFFPLKLFPTTLPSLDIPSMPVSRFSLHLEIHKGKSSMVTEWGLQRKNSK